MRPAETSGALRGFTRESTREKGVRAAIMLSMSLATVVLASLASPAWTAMRAQAAVRAEDVRVGSEQERYLRALSVLAPVARAGDAAQEERAAHEERAARFESWSMRPVAGERMLSSLAGLDGPWALDTARADGLRLHDAAVDYSFNSGLPSTTADGPAWSGRGSNVRASGTLLYSRGQLHVRLAPTFWAAQNMAFDLVPTTGAFPWSDAALPDNIDLPQRFGDASMARVDPGESTVELRSTYARLALTSAAAHLGPATDHSLIMQGDAGGFPRLVLGTPGGVHTSAGTFAAQVAWGRTAQTTWAPRRQTGSRFTSYLMGTWQPSFAQRVEVGMVRLLHRDWEHITARELLVPFGSVYSAVGGSYVTHNDNQMASAFMRLRVPEAGLEFFGEFGKNDRSRDWRDQVQELDHNSAWLAGMQKVWRGDAGRLWALHVTAVSGSIAPIIRFRPQAFFYEHGSITQGHTLRGQLLGTPLLQREGGAELRLDRYDSAGRLGLVLRTRSLPNERAEFVAPENVRQEWMAMLEMMRWTRAGSWSARVGGVADLGYSPVSGDAFSLHIGLGWARR